MHIRSRRLVYSLAGILLIVSIVLTGCASNNGSITNAGGGKGCTKIGILLPETISSARWETKDHPLLVQAVTAAIPGAHIDYSNAQGNSDTQLAQAETDLANGDCILVVGPHDSVAAAAIVEKAKAYNVPVIAYDRFIQSRDVSYYVSFNNVAVGTLQGRYIAEHYQEYTRAGESNTVIISGSQTDGNALLFSEGAHEILDPLFANGSLKNAYESFTPDWNAASAQTETEVALNNQHNNVQIVYVANDDMADSVIKELSKFRLNGKVLVTGQDATVTGIHNILAGNQNMTVYKPIAKEAQSAGELVKAIYSGTNVNAQTNGATSATADGSNIPSVLDSPIAVDSSNIASTVIADHYVTKSEVCAGIPVGTDGVC